MNVEEQNFSEDLENLPENPIADGIPVEDPISEAPFENPIADEAPFENPIADEAPFEEQEEEETEALQIEGFEGDSSEMSNQEDASKKHSAEASKELNRKQLYEAFLAELEGLTDPEVKLRHVIDFMVAALATKHGAPYFKGFWDARTIALQLFKDNINPVVRAELWNKYAELSKEARRLKETLDEQSAFAAEQIEIAIKAIENEQENPSAALEVAIEDDLLNQCQTLKEQSDYYEQTQLELHLLNTHASRITALRKELIRIEMRVRQKNKFFQRLSSLGDKTFPRRKDLIKELSQHFVADIDHFVERYFSNEDFKESIFFLREEIKILQAIAKYLTLNTQAFTYTRMRLSECWDKLKSCDKERKRQRAQHKALYKENADVLFQKLAEIEQQLQAAALNPEAAHDALDGVFAEVRQTELGRDEIKALRDRIADIRQPLIDQAKAEEQQRIQQLQEKDKLKKLKLQELKNEINATIADLDNYDAVQLSAKRDEFLQKIAEISATKLEKQELERLLKSIREAIVEKKENDVLALSDDDRQAVEQLREVLQQRKERRQEIKKQLELLRKGSGSSGLDFEQAMNFNLQVTTEKERLEKISEGIKEIEDKIAERLKAKINDA